MMKKFKYLLEKHSDFPILALIKQSENSDIYFGCPYNSTNGYCGEYCPHFNISEDFQKDNGGFKMFVTLTCGGSKVKFKIDNPEILEEEKNEE